MTHYLTVVTLTVFPMAVLIALIKGYTIHFPARCRNYLFLAGITFGTITAVVVGVLELTTAVVVREYYNLTILLPLIIFQLSLIVLIFMRSDTENVHIFFLTAGFIALYLPDIFIMPKEFTLGMDNIFNAEFAAKLTGYLAALSVAILAGVFTYKISLIASKKQFLVLFCGVLLVGLLQEVLSALYVMLARSMIPRSDYIIDFVFFFGDFATRSTILIAVFVLIFAVFQGVKSYRAVVAGENPALKRREKAIRQSRLRICTAHIFLLGIAVFFVTGCVWLENRKVEVSPPKVVMPVNGVIELPISEFDDKKLHRYSYITDNGTDVRFIIIKKPRSGYGVGLDACDICGTAGYYERKKQVVCARCDVVMNISTIGFKGGCNPVPFAYELRDMKIFIDVSVLVENEYRFK